MGGWVGVFLNFRFAHPRHFPGQVPPPPGEGRLLGQLQVAMHSKVGLIADVKKIETCDKINIARRLEAPQGGILISLQGDQKSVPL